MIVAFLMAAGAISVVVAWRLVAHEVVSVWSAMGVALGIAGLAALATGRVALSSEVSWPGSAAAGAAAGALLYLATVAFVAVVRRWHLFERHVAEVYDQRRGMALAPALVLAAAVVAPGEELFWRGLFQRTLAEVLSPWSGALATWGAYVAANAAAVSLPILVAATVSGAVWGALALWTGGVLASILCHAVWTALMVGLPPGSRSRMRSGGMRRSEPVGDP